MLQSSYSVKSVSCASGSDFGESHGAAAHRTLNGAFHESCVCFRVLVQAYCNRHTILLSLKNTQRTEIHMREIERDILGACPALITLSRG
jgi:hypothetical protein